MNIDPTWGQPICSQEAARAAGLDVAPTIAELAVCAETIVNSWGDANPINAEADLARAVTLLSGRARQAEDAHDSPLHHEYRIGRDPENSP